MRETNPGPEKLLQFTPAPLCPARFPARGRRGAALYTPGLHRPGSRRPIDAISTMTSRPAAPAPPGAPAPVTRRDRRATAPWGPEYYRSCCGRESIRRGRGVLLGPRGLGIPLRQPWVSPGHVNPSTGRPRKRQAPGALKGRRPGAPRAHAKPPEVYGPGGMSPRAQLHQTTARQATRAANSGTCPFGLAKTSRVASATVVLRLRSGTGHAR